MQGLKLNKKLTKQYVIAFTSILLLSCGNIVNNNTPPPNDADLLKQKSQPNIVLLIAEDISPYLGCYGDSVAMSPTIDKLASQGIRFSNMYSPVGVCAPSRFALMTGMFPTSAGANNMRTGGGPKAHPFRMPPYQVVLPEGVKCFTEYLRQAGYYCTNNRKADYQFSNQPTFWDESNNGATWENCPKDKPFFSVFTYLESHESKVWESRNDTLWVSPEEVIVPPYLLNDSIGKRDMAVMYSNIYRMDQRVKQEIDKLEKAGKLNNTILIFMSDNGGPMPRQKRSLYDRGTKIPFIVVFPDKQKAGSTSDEFLSMVDIPPTILSLAGITPPKLIDGKAFLGEHKQGSVRNYVFSIRERMDACYDKQISIRNKEYRYVYNYLTNQPEYLNVGYRLNMPSMRQMLENKDSLSEEQASWFVYPRKKEELYKCHDDPHELYNLAHKKEYASVLKEMRKLAKNVEQKYWPYKDFTEYDLIDSIGNIGALQVSLPIISKTSKGATLSCKTTGVSYAYQINGDGNLRSGWSYYVEPIKLNKGDNLKVIAARAGYKQSGIVEFVQP